MKLSFFPLLILPLVGLVACAGESRMTLPVLAATQDESVAKACAAVFPRGRWQFIHAIEFSQAGGSGSTVLGVTSLDGDEIGCALMTSEGFTLFTAVAKADGGLEVRRAVPPFDRPGFAEGLMRDVRMIFLPPSAAKVRYGRLADKTPVCRYTGAEGRITDILPGEDGCWRINSFSPDAVRDRALVGRSCRGVGDVQVPGYLELQGFAPRGYTLKMTLVNPENLNPNMRQ